MRHQILLLTVIRITEDAVSKTNATKRYLYFENSDFNVSTSSTNSPTSHLSNKSGGKSAKIKGLGLLRTSGMSSYEFILRLFRANTADSCSIEEPKAKIRASFCFLAINVDFSSARQSLSCGWEQLQNTRPSQNVSRIYCSRGPAVRNDLTMWQMYE